jgi:hypothetical protein
MPLYAGKKTFKPAPEGLWDGVCIDVVDKGFVPTQYGPKHKVQFRWVVEATPKRSDGKPHMISWSYPISLDERAGLRQMLETWRGRAFTKEEVKKFDLETVLGAQCQIQVTHKEGTDGDPFAKPQVVMRAKAGVKVLAPPDYVRESERPGYKAPAIPDEDSQEQPLEDADYIPDEQEDPLPF